MTTVNVDIVSRDYWFKVVDFLQQNWALIDVVDGGPQCTVYFFGDTAGVFDRMSFNSGGDATRALRRNGFRRYVDDAEFQQVARAPAPPFHEGSHPSGAIYSSGRFWR